MTVELYDAAGAFVTSTTTSVVGGSYSFDGLAAVDYIVRVVNAGVTSSRPGSDGSELGVQTYRTDGEPPGTGAKKVGGGDVNGVDSGFNFDVIVNTNDAGQGTLRQFVLNSDLLK